VHARLSWMVSDRVDRAADESRLALETLDPVEDRELVGFALLYQAQWDLLAGRGADQAALDRGRELTEGTDRSWLTPTVGATWAKMLDDFPTACDLYAAYLREGEAAGDDIAMATNLANLAEIAARTGDLPEAERLIERSVAIGSGMGSSTWEAVALGPAALVDALSGRHAEARAHAARILELIGDADEPLIEAHARAVLGFLALTEGDPAAADRELSRADAGLSAMGMVEPAPYRFHADHVEAVVALGDLDRAAELTRRLEARREVLPKPWTVVMAARARGLLEAAGGELEAAEASAMAALDGHQALGMPFERGRDLLLLGILLRRRRRRSDAARRIEEAARAFETIGSPRWAERARDELERLGITPGEADQLTPSEERIARLAATGLTNRDVAHRLRISPKTVEASLTRAYAKLGIRTRAELGRWASQPGPGTNG
jgi:DNA-binding CsgD family transcriptional regulator/tetratricopeptide (TPR) repeat protein